MTRAISAKVPEELHERILEEQEEGESKSATMRRLIRDGLSEQPPGREGIIVIVFSMVLGGMMFLDFGRMAIYTEAAIFHLLVATWVLSPRVKRLVKSYRS